MSAEKVTLLIPTMNRSDFLIRLLRYYRSVCFQGYICIGDSSNAEHLEPTKRAIESLQGRLNIIYREYPGSNNAECLQQLIDLAPTPYIAYLADDDFLVPAALEKCALFLDSHPDYSAAHGLGVVFILKSSGAYGKFASVTRYRQAIIEAESGSERLIAHLSDYKVPLFSVHHIESWREMYKDSILLTDTRFGTELLPCCIDVVLGKVKELDSLYLARQGHDRRYMLPGKAEWMARPDYLPSYEIFRDSLTRVLAQQDGISIDEAFEVVEEAFSRYLSRSFVETWYSRSWVLRLLRIGRMVPGARQVWRASRFLLRSMHLIGRNEIPVMDLLSSSSPYQADFLPVYRSVTGAAN